MKNKNRLRRTRLQELKLNLIKRPIIASLMGIEDVYTASEHGVKTCFYLKGDIFELREILDHCKQKNLMLLVHVDLIAGIAKDSCGMEILARELGVDGILTTRGYLISAAQKMGMLAIQRTFMLDSEALRTGVDVLRSNQPDGVEILPALVFPHIGPRLSGQLPLVIAGGLVETKEQVENILQPPVAGVSTSKKELWNYVKL
ncbi:MAG TPA: glycerol-3-phosphate responsive antiterminator [Firmicutes bacterium]|nr:glycerol-3-phosphate responsive antiterminator [Bacillota bacterium]